MKFATCLAVVFASAVSAQAGQPVSVNALNAVGLSNVVVMSDAQGTQIRAKGKARTSGSSTVNSSAKQVTAQPEQDPTIDSSTDGTATNSANSRSKYNGGALAGHATLSGSASGATNNGSTSASGSIAGGGAIAYGR